MCDKLHVHLCLAASGDTLNQISISKTGGNVAFYRINHTLLRGIQYLIIGVHTHMLHRISVAGLCDDLDKTALLKRSYSGSRHRQLACHKGILKARPIISINQRTKKPGLCLLFFCLAKRKLRPCLYLVYFQCNTATHLLLSLLLYRYNSLKRLIHGRAVIAPYPCRKCDELCLHSHRVCLYPDKRLCPCRVVLRLIRDLNHIACDSAAAKWNIHAHTRTDVA